MNESELTKMAEEVGDGGETSSSMTSSSSSMGEKLKLICSHGGKILPRPFDGNLKYVGGETRVISIPRSITFSELMNKINDIFDGEYILKYQIASEDLDSLVSVKSDEDIRHLVDEHDRIAKGGSKLRTFLFPIKPVVMETHNGQPPSEQRFVDAINGIVRPTNMTTLKPSHCTTRLKSSSVSPIDGSSPQSLSPRSVAHTPPTSQNSWMTTLQSRLARMHRIQSSPSFSSLSGSHTPGSDASSFSNNCIQQQQQPPRHCHCCLPSQQYQQRYPSPCKYNYQSSPPSQEQYLHHGYHSPTNHLRHHRHTSPQPTISSNTSKGCFVHEPRYHHNSSYYHPLLRPYPGSGGQRRYGPLEQYATASFGNNHFSGIDTLGDHWE